MKNSIGIRVTPRVIFYCISSCSSKNKYEIISVAALTIPVSLEIPQKLKYVRNTFCDILTEYNIGYAGVRITEYNSRMISVERISYESIIQELFASSSIERYFVGTISTISSKLSIKNDGTLKKYINGDLNYTVVPNWLKFKKEERESILASLGALV